MHDYTWWGRWTTSPTRAAVYVLVVALAAISVWRAFHLPSLLIMGDDGNILPDRAWFSGNFDWLKYLLFYNQTRYSNVGDYMLVRPVLFFYLWLMDIFFRDDRLVHYWACLSMVFFAAGSLFWIVRRFVPFVGAVAIALGFLSFTKGALFHWDTMSVYLLSIAFLGLGMVFLIEDQERHPQRISWRSLAFLLIATLCHEVAAISLLGITTLAFWLEYKNRKTFFFHVLSISLIWLLFYSAVMLLTGNHAVYSPGELERTLKVVNSDQLQYLKIVLRIMAVPVLTTALCLFFSFFYIREQEFAVSKKEKWILLSIIVPTVGYLLRLTIVHIGYSQLDRALVLFYFFIAGVVFISFLFCNRRPWKLACSTRWMEKWILLSVVVSMASMTVGLLLGRVLTRLSFAQWYHTLYIYFFLIACAALIGLLLRNARPWKLAGWGLIVLLLVIDATLLNVRAHEAHDREAQLPVWSGLTTDIRAYFGNHPEKCMAGIKGFDSGKLYERYTSLFEERDFRGGDIEESLNTMFYYFSCGFRKKSEPTYLNVAGENGKYHFKPIQEVWSNKREYRTMDLSRESTPQYLRQFLATATMKSMGHIWWQHIPVKHITGKGRSCLRSEKFVFSEAKLNIFSRDDSPVSYNFGISIQTHGDKDFMLIFQANMVSLLEISQHSGSLPATLRHAETKNLLREVSSSGQKYNPKAMHLNSMPKEFSVRFKSVRNGIEVFFQEQLLGLLSMHRSGDPHYVHVCSFDNGTPPEEIKSFSYVD